MGESKWKEICEGSLPEELRIFLLVLSCFFEVGSSYVVDIDLELTIYANLALKSGNPLISASQILR